MRREGLEPSSREACAPQTHAYTNSATCAKNKKRELLTAYIFYHKFFQLTIFHCNMLHFFRYKTRQLRSSRTLLFFDILAPDSKCIFDII